MTEPRIALRIIVDGKEKDVSFEELTLSNNLALEALARVLIEKKLLEAQDLLAMMERVKTERYKPAAE